MNRDTGSKQEYDDNEGWVEPDDFFCLKCNRLIELPKNDGPYEYYETNGLHGQVCPECNRQLCDDCANWQKSNESFSTICFGCFDKERRNRFDMSLHNAIIFAVRKHSGQLRKGTDIPYIAHIMEVMQILIENNCREEVIIAGILHDTLEDTDTTPDEIKHLFGKKVLSIVQSETEDKSLSWLERKTITIDHLKTVSLETKLVCCADKLSNIRSIYADLQTIGDKVWERFNESKEKIQWYYESNVSALSDISEAAMYYDLKEMVGDVFNMDWSSPKVD
jgi:(p)ppGpp synthase/HD superfamily hydrolase